MGELLSVFTRWRVRLCSSEQYELQLRQEATSREDELRRVGQRLSAQLESAQDQVKASQRMQGRLKHQLTQREQQESDRLRDLQRELEALRSSSALSSEKLQRSFAQAMPSFGQRSLS